MTPGNDQSSLRGLPRPRGQADLYRQMHEERQAVNGVAYVDRCIEEIAIYLYNFDPKLQPWNGDPYWWGEHRVAEEREKFRDRARQIRELVLAQL